jgi:hypothetical protein
MSGYWRDIIIHGHKTGPYRMSIDAVKEYEKAYNEPFDGHSYRTSGFKTNNGQIVDNTCKTFLHHEHIDNLTPSDMPSQSHKTSQRDTRSQPIIVIGITEEYIRQFDEIKNKNEIDKEKKEKKEKEKKNNAYKLTVKETKYALHTILKNERPSEYGDYSAYKPFIRNMDIEDTTMEMAKRDKLERDTREKSGYTNMLSPNAYSSTVNINKAERSKNVIMIYYSRKDSKLIFSPWNGLREPDSNTSESTSTSPNTSQNTSPNSASDSDYTESESDE